MDSKTRHPKFTEARSGPSRDFQEIIGALARWKFPEGIEGVVAIAAGGIVPGALFRGPIQFGRWPWEVE